MTERVLITGGAGFIGSHLTDACLAKGYKVRVLDNLTMGKASLVSPEAELIIGDIRDAEACRAAAKDCVGIMHLAAMSRSAASLDSVDICTSNNIIGTQNILNAARETGVKRVVYAGSSTFYGSQKPPHFEQMRPQYLNFYGLSKHMGEEFCLLFDRLYGVEANVLRFFNVYGPRLTGEGQYALVMSIFLQQFGQGKPLTIHGSGAQARDFVHVRDVVRAVIMALESPVHGEVFNVGTGIPITVKELADVISSNQIHEERRAADAEITMADISSIKAKLGWEPQVSFTQGLAELLESYTEEAPEVVH